MSVSDIKVLKRNGEHEPITLDKIHRVLEWATEGLDGVSISQVELSAQIQFYDGITTKTIHDTLVKAAADLITPEAPDYQYLAARLAMFDIRKMAYGDFTPPGLYDHVVSMANRGLYDPHILEDYTKEELDQISDMVDHDRDMTFSHAAISQFTGKYLVQDRTTGMIYESPQYLFVLIAVCLFSKYPKETRMGYIKQFYDGVSTFKFSLPTPIMGGVRTPTRQFSSCVLVDCGDSLDSINATTSAIVKYISQRAGIGINGGAIRAMGEPIRNGEAAHTGVIPFYKMFQAAVKSCSQGGIRGGSATLFYPLWHREVESMLVLRNNRGVEENRIRHLDYGVQINALMYRRLRNNENITLFSPDIHSTPGLYEAFYANQEEFERLYLKYEADDSIRKKSIPAVELFSLLMQERASTGRIYIMNVDNANKQGPFLPDVAPIRQSNLCVAPETKILTTDGQVRIDTKVGEEVEVWNGEEWSKVTVEKTGENQELWGVITEHGHELDATPYHKWYVVRDGATVEVRTNELVVGDKLLPANTVVVPGTVPFDNAYEMASDTSTVPSGNVVLKDRVSFIQGLVDCTGSMFADGNKRELEIKYTYKVYLMSVQLLLQTMGVESKISMGDQSFVLTIDDTGVKQLQSIGLVTTDMELSYKPISALGYNTIKVVRNFGRTDDTYCFTEPKRHMGMFNGILTGQCMEIALPTTPLNNIDDPEGEIALCTLSAFNLGAINGIGELKGIAEIVVRALDALLSYQDYPVLAGQNGALKRRSLGVGVINYAYYLAKNGVKYSDGSANDLTHKTFEAIQYYLLKASNKLAKEFGVCDAYEETKYAKGLLPIDTYNKRVDTLVNVDLQLDWESLRKDIAEYGLRNSTLTALMPSETSSQISNATNGIEPPRGLVSIKQSKDGILRQVVPEIRELGDKYELLWDIKDNRGYLALNAIMQKFVDQAISTNTSYNPANYPGGKVPMNVLLGDLVWFYAHGGKTLYYHNTHDGSGEEVQVAAQGCESGACAI